MPLTGTGLKIIYREAVRDTTNRGDISKDKSDKQAQILQSPALFPAQRSIECTE